MRWIRHLPGLDWLNAQRRAFEVERKYAMLSARYEGRADAPDFSQLWADRGLSALALPSAPRVLFCGTDRLQDYGGFIQSLTRRCDLRVLERADGSYGQSVDGVRWCENRKALSDALKGMRREGWSPEIVLMQSMGMRFHPQDLLRLKAQYGFKILNIGMDERLAYVLGSHDGVELGIRGLNDVVDLALVTVPEAVRWYAMDGVPAKYFPLASDPGTYFPIVGEVKTYDVGFIGRAYGRRLRIARKIAALGIGFRGHGPGWESGALPVEENNSFYSKCRVVLGTGNIGHSKRLMNPKLRDFEVPLTAVPYITNYTPELAELYEEGSEILLYRSEEELLMKLQWLMEHSDEAAAIGRAGYSRAMTEHLYDDRWSVLFDQILKGDLMAEFVERRI